MFSFFAIWKRDRMCATKLICILSCVSAKIKIWIYIALAISYDLLLDGAPSMLYIATPSMKNNSNITGIQG